MSSYVTPPVTQVFTFLVYTYHSTSIYKIKFRKPKLSDRSFVFSLFVVFFSCADCVFFTGIRNYKKFSFPVMISFVIQQTLRFRFVQIGRSGAKFRRIDYSAKKRQLSLVFSIFNDTPLDGMGRIFNECLLSSSQYSDHVFVNIIQLFFLHLIRRMNISV